MFEVLAVLFVILQVGVLASLAVMAFSINNRLEDIHSQIGKFRESLRNDLIMLRLHLADDEAYPRDVLTEENLLTWGERFERMQRKFSEACRAMPDPKEA